MWSGRRRDERDLLSRYWNAVAARRSVEAARLRQDLDRLDPTLSETVDRLRARDDARLPNPVFLDRLEQTLMHESHSAHPGMIPLRPTAPGPSNGRLHAEPERQPLFGTPGSRRGWVFAQFATTLLLIVTLAAIYFAFIRGEHPAHQPASPFPATVIPAPTTEPATDDWTTFLGDAARSNIAGAGPVERPNQLWRVQAGGLCDASPVVIGRTVYAACGDGVLYALDAATGTERWRYTISRPWSRVAAAAGLVYAVDGVGTLYAVDMVTGQERWRVALSVSGDPAIEDGLLVVGTTDGYLIGLDAATSAERWRTQIDTSRGAHTPALAGGNVYASSETGGLVAVEAVTGVLRWRADIGSDSSSTARTINGVVYLGGGFSGFGRLRAFDAETGAVLWTSDLPLGGLTVSGDLGFAGGDGSFYALDVATGIVQWQVPVSGQSRGAIVAGDLVYVFSDGDQNLYAFDVATGRERWRYDLGEAINSSFSMAGGVIYIGTGFGGVIALGETDGTPVSDGAGTAAVSPSVAPATPVSSATPVSPLASAASPEATATPER